MKPVVPFSPARRRRIRGQNYELIIETHGNGDLDAAFRVWGAGLGPAFHSAKAALTTVDDLEQADADFIVEQMKRGIVMMGPRCAGANFDLLKNDEPIKLIELAKQHEEKPK